MISALITALTSFPTDKLSSAWDRRTSANSTLSPALPAIRGTYKVWSFWTLNCWPAIFTTANIKNDIRAAKVRGIGEKKKRKAKKWGRAANLPDFSEVGVFGYASCRQSIRARAAPVARAEAPERNPG